VNLDEFDTYMSEFKYLDKEKQFPVTDKLKQHLTMASLSEQYKTVMFNFKIANQNGHYDEVLLVSRVYTSSGSDYLFFTVIKGKVDATPIPKYNTYTTTKCECVWYTLCIENKCTITTHYVPRAYTSTEITNFELAMRFRTYYIIIDNLYNNRDEFDFTGIAALTEYVSKLQLPPASAISNQT